MTGIRIAEAILCNNRVKMRWVTWGMKIEVTATNNHDIDPNVGGEY